MLFEEYIMYFRNITGLVVSLIHVFDVPHWAPSLKSAGIALSVVSVIHDLVAKAEY